MAGEGFADLEVDGDLRIHREEGGGLHGACGQGKEQKSRSEECEGSAASTPRRIASLLFLTAATSDGACFHR